MPVFRLDERCVFPPPELAEPDGLLAVGGDLRAERLIRAYEAGIFPWYGPGLPILWHSPDPRFVLTSSKLHVPRSLDKELRRGRTEVRFDTAFSEVVAACAEEPRTGQWGTWISPEMRGAYEDLFARGVAHSAEAYREGVLVGGLYGVSLGGAFFGESMFAKAPDASKVAFVTLVRALEGWGIDLIDCQVHTEHLERFGAEAWPRTRFLEELGRALARPTRLGPWQRPGGQGLG